MDGYKYHMAIFGIASACAAAPARAAVGDSMWKFFSDFAVTVVEPAPGLAGHRGAHRILAGGKHIADNHQRGASDAGIGHSGSAGLEAVCG